MANVETLGATPGEQVEYVLVRQLVSFFSSNQVAARRGIHELLVRSPYRALDAIYKVLAENTSGDAESFLIQIIAAEEARLSPLVTGTVDLAAGVRIGRALSKLEGSFEPMLLRQATREREPDAMIRALSILEEICDCTRIVQQLQILARQPNELIRSKAARLLARASREKDRLALLFADPDPRVRSNTAEAYFTHRPTAAESEELWKLAADRHHRPATTALAVLAYHGDPQASAKLVELINSADLQLQVAAAWAMGRTGNPAYLPVLQGLVREQTGSLKRMSMRSCSLIRKATATPA